MAKPGKRALGLMPAGIGTALLLLTTSNPVYGSAADPASDPKVAAASQAQWTLPLDVTGDAALAEERDRLRNMLKPLADYDGGMIWDPAGKVLTVQMTSNAAITQAREMVAATGTNLQIKYARVQYSAMELEELSNRLLGNQLQGAGAQGLGGGHDVRSNRVILQVDREYKDAATLVSAIENLKDPRVSLEVIDAVDDWKPESRVAE